MHAIGTPVKGALCIHHALDRCSWACYVYSYDKYVMKILKKEFANVYLTHTGIKTAVRLLAFCICCWYNVIGEDFYTD